MCLDAAEGRWQSQDRPAVCSAYVAHLLLPLGGDGDGAVEQRRRRSQHADEQQGAHDAQGAPAGVVTRSEVCHGPKLPPLRWAPTARTYRHLPPRHIAWLFAKVRPDGRQASILQFLRTMRMLWGKARQPLQKMQLNTPSAVIGAGDTGI